jgi:NAD(P)-dependent dehydrogenase (short-subunit alcohol dehydrogenase family)
MTGKLGGKVAIVTGAGQGAGMGAALALAADGAALLSITPEVVSELWESGAAATLAFMRLHRGWGSAPDRRRESVRHDRDRDHRRCAAVHSFRACSSLIRW